MQLCCSYILDGIHIIKHSFAQQLKKTHSFSVMNYVYWQYFLINLLHKWDNKLDSSILNEELLFVLFLVWFVVFRCTILNFGAIQSIVRHDSSPMTIPQHCFFLIFVGSNHSATATNIVQPTENQELESSASYLKYSIFSEDIIQKAKKNFTIRKIFFLHNCLRHSNTCNPSTWNTYRL